MVSNSNKVNILREEQYCHLAPNALKEKIMRSADAFLREFEQHQEVQAGHNGPYFDKESNTRNIAHWTITMCFAFEQTSDIRYKKCVEELSTLLKDPKRRPDGFTYFHRSKPGKDQCNGLIGQAWCIEALASGYRVTQDEQLKSLALDVFSMHKFDERRAIWVRKECDGKDIGFDYTFNHQLWFAMSILSLEPEDPEVKGKVKSFLDGVERNLVVRRRGRIGQQIYISFKDSTLKPIIKRAIRPRWHHDMFLKEVGYHSFNTYAFAVIRQLMPDHYLWETKKFRSTILYLSSREYIENLALSKYSFSYNPPGFEVMFSYQVFGDFFLGVEKESRMLFDQLLATQVDEGFGGEEVFLTGNNTFDEATHAARLYEATRLKFSI